MKQQPISHMLQNRSILLALGVILLTVTSVFAGTESYTEQVAHAPIFAEPLIWVGAHPPDETESRQLWEITGEGHNKFSDAAAGFEEFIKKHPASPWNPSLESHLAEYYYQSGYFTPALLNWQAAWAATGQGGGWKEHHIADEVLINWLHLLASLGRTETMKELLDETKNRQMSPIFEGPYRQAKEVYGIMLNHPDISYRCGTYALNAAAEVLTGKSYFTEIWEKPSPITGFSMADLVRLSESNHLGMVAVERPNGHDLVVPSVVHWKQNHYAAIIAQRGNLYEVIDPTFQMKKWLSADAINEECSGQFIVPAKQKPATWRTLSNSEASQIFGKGFPDNWAPLPCDGLGNGGNDGNINSSCSLCSQIGSFLKRLTSIIGMPDWTITEPGCDIWLHDNPLEYQPSKGPAISFRLSYSQEPNNNATAWVYPINNFEQNGQIFSFGLSWYPSWLSAILWDGVSDAQLLAPGGGAVDYTNQDGSVPEFATNTRMLLETNADGSTKGFCVIFPSGATNVYEESYEPGNYRYYFLTKEIDPQGNFTTYIYSNNVASSTILLQYVVDGDGKTNTLTYTNISFSYYEEGGSLFTNVYSNFVSQITDRYKRVVQFTYPYMGMSAPTLGLHNPYLELTNIVDVIGISSSFDYDSFGSVTQMVTPYGPTTFYTLDQLGSGAINSIIDLITDPSGGCQMFLYIGDVDTDFLQGIPKVYADPHYVPTYRPNDGALGGSNTLDNPDWANSGADDHMQLANSFYWGRQQFANMSSNFLANWSWAQLTTNDYARARMRHWNQTPTGGQGFSLSMERDPSPDAAGTIMGGMTWYDYPGKPAFNVQGTATTPIMIIKVLPDGSERYTINQLDQWNNITNSISTYSENGTILLRTNRYVFAANGQDLVKSVDAAGLTTCYGYTNHDVTSVTNSLAEVTAYTYDPGTKLLTSITQPNGQVTTNIYGADGYLANQIVIGISTNLYTYTTNGLVYTHTDERGLTVTNTWDALRRLTQTAYPDGTVSYTYSNLDLVKFTDRMGYSTYYTYNPIRQKTSVIDAMGRTNYYGYCECGALDSIIDALNNTNSFVHDNQGNLTETVYQDGYTVTNTYNLLRQLVTKSDSSGLSITNYYNNQGLLITSSNNVGQILALAYDVDDRTTNSTDANNVSVATKYDNLSRIRTNSYPDGGIEKWVYTPNVAGPTSYTNQINNEMIYTYDSIGRKISEVCVGVTTNKFSYDGAGDLLTLTDGKNDMTTWGYDQYGRVTNKLDMGNTNFVYRYDADDRLTNRWTPARGNTAYGYDGVGNLTNIGYNITHSISLSYDADNRLSSMIDGVGTTAYSYDQAGQLLSEGGLWPSDTVSNRYQNRLRMELILNHPGGSAWTNDYSYDNARRLNGVESPAGDFYYSYDPVKLQRVDELLLPNSAYITNTYDSVARLLSTSLVNTDGTNLDSAYYVYNTAGQRTNEINAAGDFRNYTYDNEGELITAVAKEAGGASRSNELFGYTYDAAGNLNFRTNNALIQAFNFNNLNELTRATNSGTLTVAGTTTIPATNVTVNGLSANHYADATFALGGFILTNGVNFYRAIGEDTFGNYSTNSVTVNLPATNNYTYDLNGNLLSDGTRNFAYDDENELISVCVSNAWSNSFAYDGKMRRRIERDYTWNSGWVETNEAHFIYDGNAVVEERSVNNNPLVSYTRGNDLSGSLQGAGGIGGMLARTTYGQEIPGAPTTAYYHADGSGNITSLMYSGQQLAAKYLYDPYGNMLALSGPLMNLNKYRFSSKEWNDNAQLYYYGYRFYDPNLQRFVNKDLLGEFGFEVLRGGNSRKAMYLIAGIPELSAGSDLYGFVGNDPVQFFDSLGLDRNSPQCKFLAAQMIYWSFLFPIYESEGNTQAAREANSRVIAINKAMEREKCFDDPPPPPDKGEPVCPRPAPVSTSDPIPYRNPSGNPPPFLPPPFLPPVGTGVGIGVDPVVVAGGIGISAAVIAGIGYIIEYGWPVLTF